MSATPTDLKDWSEVLEMQSPSGKMLKQAVHVVLHLQVDTVCCGRHRLSNAVSCATELEFYRTVHIPCAHYISTVSSTDCIVAIL